MVAMLLALCGLLISALGQTEGRVFTRGQHEADVRETRAAPKCMDELGCFPITKDFFHPLYRPFNVVPADRERINTKFLAYTLAHPKQAFSLKTYDNKLLLQSKFDPKKPTKIIVHGILDNQWFAEWMRQMKDEFLLNGDFNVIIVDWSGGNAFPYTQATANTRVVGAEIAWLLNWLKESQGLKLEDVHILGHSLGAHVAGYAGARLVKLGRITGMDPAEPYFQNLPTTVRLDPSDADFVDVIHSDAISFFTNLGFGMSQLVGHVDFFPNDGEGQPGCNLGSNMLTWITEGLVAGGRSFLACNHMRAVDFERQSINHHTCVPVAYACPSWELFLQGRCADCGAKGERCAPMGDKAWNHYYQHKNDTKQQKFYLKTLDKPPFCLFHYQVTVKLAAVGKDQEGTLGLTLTGENSEQSIKFNLGDGKKMMLYPGSSYTFLETTVISLGDLVSAKFEWDGGINWPLTRKEITLETLRVLPMNSVDPSVRSSQTRKYCSSKLKPIKSRGSYTFTKSENCAN